MTRLAPPLSPEAWMRDLFSSRAARDGAVIRRKLRDIDRIVGRRGYTAVETAGQLVIFCNREPVRRFTAARTFAKSPDRKL